MTATATTRARQQQQSAEQRQALLAQQRQRSRARRIVLAAIGTVLAVVATLVVVGATTGGSSAPVARPNKVPPVVLTGLTSISDATLASIGRGTSVNPPRAISGEPRMLDGKPQVLYLGAEYCPFCAVQRWPLIQALSRFGHFMGLQTTRSAADDVHPNTATFTFHGATYMSDYIAFTARELYTNERVGGSYRPLDKARPEEAALLQHYGGSFPLLDLGGRFVQVGASYDANLLRGLEWEQIAGALGDSKSPLAQSIDGSANVLTAAICTLTGQQPAAVCDTPAVRAASRG